MFENIHNAKDLLLFVGNYSPHIEAVIVILSLLKQIPYLKGYLVFLIINNFINWILKSSIGQPRPNGGKTLTGNDISKKDIENSDDMKYGMPSRHAQGVFFSLTFLYLVRKDPLFLLLGLFLAVLGWYQRYTYKRHTLEQLFVGSVVGIVIGYISYLITKRYIHTLS